MERIWIFMKITEDIIYAGVNDHQVDLFEGQYRVPNGMAYNSYVILDEKTAVMDTVDANVHLGFLPDEREYGVGAQILHELGVHKMRLLTNNPVKRVGLEAYGLEIVENVPIEVPVTPYDEKYMRTKKERMGHTLHFNK